MKLVSIGNSFSQDAQRWLHELAAGSGENIDTYNLFIGGCSLATHMDCIRNHKADYSLEGNGNRQLKITTANEVIENDTFDVITVQQASGFSGRPQTYVPYLADLAAYVREHQPQAELYFHQTWSYETDSTHGHFAFYHHDQGEMFRRIADCSETAKKQIGVSVLPVGAFLQYLRENTTEFDYPNGGLSLCRDGFHLSETYGRFAAAAVWFSTLTGKDADARAFAETHKEFDRSLLDVIMEKWKEFRNIPALEEL